MDLEQLREQICASLLVQAPQLDDVAPLVDECLASARQAFRDAFICQLSPDAWAKITLIYHKHFLDTGCDVTLAEIVATVVRDAIGTRRMDMLTLELAQQKEMDGDGDGSPPALTLVKD